MLFAMEIRQLFLHPRIFHFIPLMLAGIFLTAWVYPVASPYSPVLIVVLYGLELQFDNILFRSPREFETLVMFPVEWRRVVMAKNLACVALVALGFIVTSMTLIHFSPASPTRGHLMSAVLYLLTILFPLIHIGNLRSIRHPRRESGLRINDLTEAVWMTASIGLLSIPYIIFMHLMESPVLCIAYVAGTIVFWYRYSVPTTSDLIGKETLTVCASR
jgi:hypothetical protein